MEPLLPSLPSSAFVRSSHLAVSLPFLFFVEDGKGEGSEQDEGRRAKRRTEPSKIHDHMLVPEVNVGNDRGSDG